MQTFEQRRQLRHALIVMAARRHRPGTGSSVAWLKETGVGAVMNVPNFDFVGAPWCVVGAVAANAYMSPRQTADLDIAILARDRPQVHRALQGKGFRHVQELNIPGSTWAAPAGGNVDVLEMSQPWAADAMLKAESGRIASVPLMPLVYLVLMKLEASRSIDVGDLSRMLALATEQQLAEIRQLVGHWMPNDIEDLEQLLALGRAELEP